MSYFDGSEIGGTAGTDHEGNPSIKVKVLIGQSPLDEASKRASATAPPHLALRYQDPRKRQLAALCRELQSASQWGQDSKSAENAPVHS
jgi:hypothetical protein